MTLYPITFKCLSNASILVGHEENNATDPKDKDWTKLSCDRVVMQFSPARAQYVNLSTTLDQEFNATEVGSESQ
jgi:hypothetical protein